MKLRALNALYGLKWNPFVEEAPLENFVREAALEPFVRRLELLCEQGGFALVSGDAGCGKSVTLRLVVHELEKIPDLQVRLLSRPQSFVGDFYRELGDLFGVRLEPHNRWAGTKVLRERWQAHIQGSLTRPLLVVDEAQETSTAVLTELRLLASYELDSKLLLTVVLAGDGRLNDRLRSAELLPLGTRIRARLMLSACTPDQLAALLDHALEAAGASQLMTQELRHALVTHAVGNRRVLMNLANEVLALGVERNLAQLDEQLFLEIAGPSARAQTQGRRR